MRVGMDLDGVVYNSDAQLRQMVQAQFHVGLDPLDRERRKEQLKAMGRKDIWKWMNDEAVDMGWFTDGHPYPGALNALAKIADADNTMLVIVTGRPKKAITATLGWLADNAVQAQEVSITAGARKSGVPCDAYVDDSPTNIDDLIQRTTAMVLLWDQPWNRDYAPAQDTGGRFHRVYNWDQVLALLGVS